MSSSEFRPLNENEKAVIIKARMKDRIREEDYRYQAAAFDPAAISVSYENMQGGFCICIIKIEIVDILKVKLLYRGASRRSYKDPRKPIKGEMLAFSRAVLYSRAVEL